MIGLNIKYLFNFISYLKYLIKVKKFNSPFNLIKSNNFALFIIAIIKIYFIIHKFYFLNS